MPQREFYSQIKPKDVARFEKRIEKLSSGCWEWQGSYHRKGHGYFSIRHRVIYAHRFAYSTYIGKIPEGMLVCHSCDNGRCVNPDHLFLGTNQDNTDDMMNKGRHRCLYGEDASSDKLTMEQVREIRTKYIPWVVSSRNLAKEYNVSHSAILSIVRHESYLE